MNRKLLICSVILGLIVGTRVHGQNPTRVCPQWQWGQTGTIFHYYAQYCEGTEPCQSLGWDNYDGTSGLDDPNKSCTGCTSCIPVLLKDDTQKKASPEGQQGAGETRQPLKKQWPKSAKGLKLDSPLKASDHPKPKNQDKIKTTILHSVVVDAKITDVKQIRVKLYLALLEPKEQPKRRILVANGFEVDNAVGPEFTVPKNAVERVDGEDFIYDITVGPVVYRVITATRS